MKSKDLKINLSAIREKWNRGQPLSDAERALLKTGKPQPAAAPAPKPPAKPAPATPAEAPKDFSINALSKITGKDRRTLDKAVADVKPTRTIGKTKFYALADIEAALKAKPGPSLRDEKLTEEIRKLRIANDREEGKVVLRATVAGSIRKSLSPAAATLEQRLVNEYPTAVAGLDVPQARIYGKRLCDELLGFFQTFKAAWPE